MRGAVKSKIMPVTIDQARSIAMQLNASDREVLAEELLQSVSESESDAIDQAWLAEVRRRDADLLAGRCKASGVDDVVNRLLAKGQL
jgi:putative addiction module component (TIGR02574 family)